MSEDINENCEGLKGLRKKLCEGWTVCPDTGEWVQLSAKEHARYLAHFAGEPVPPKEIDPKARKRHRAALKEGAGTELERLFAALGIASCGRCAKLRDEMNIWGVDECDRRTEEILERLKQNAEYKPELKRLFTKKGAGIFLDQAIFNARRRKLGEEVPEGALANLWDIAKSKFRGTGNSALTWSYGVTTVPARLDDLLPRTLKSLHLAGFTHPHLFVDQCTDPTKFRELGLRCTFHDGIGAFGNWMTALWELYTSNPQADRYAIFQDDFVTCLNLREYLEKCEYPTEGYMNLYTFPQNHTLIKNNGIGWHVANQRWRGLGAVALVFTNEAVIKLLPQPHLVGRVKDPERGHKYIDGGVVDAFAAVGWKEYVHHPSLVQHTGDVRTLGTGTQPKSPSFPGEQFNALDFLSEDS